MTVYGHMTQTAAATDENPKGNFEFVYNYVLDKEDTQTAENMEMEKISFSRSRYCNNERKFIRIKRI